MPYNSGRSGDSEGLICSSSHLDYRFTREHGSDSNDFTGVHDVVWIECLFNRAHYVDCLDMLGGQEPHLPRSHAMFAGPRPLHRERTRHHPVIEMARLDDLLRPVRIDHEDEMKV